MKMKSFILITTLSLCILSSCSKSDENQEDIQILFGHFFGECFGETCVETFVLTNDKLQEDTKDIYRGTEFDFVDLPNEKFELVKDLMDKFPIELLDEEEEVFGCPDCGDWGGIYIGYQKDGELQSWFADYNIDDNPEYIRDFIIEIQDKIKLINE